MVIHHRCNARCKNNLIKQCTFKATSNSIFCKKHLHISIDSKYNINNPLFSDIEINNFINNYILNNSIKKNNILLIEYILFKNNYFTIYDINKKNLIYYFNNYIYYYNNLNSIILIQSIIRKNNILNLNKLKGPGLLNKHKSNNSKDFYTFQSINSIKYHEFFSYKEKDHVYSFDIRSFKLLFDNSNNNQIYNPYNRNIIPNNIIKNFTLLSEYLNKHNLFKSYEKDILTIEQQNMQNIIKIFQKIDAFGYNTNITWFSTLSIIKLYKLWSHLEDIWNYRANLSKEQKNNIINNKKPFIHFYKFNKYKNLEKEQLQKYILEDFDLFLSNGINKDYSNIGCLYILTSLSLVSNECLISMPWLNQMFF